MEGVSPARPVYAAAQAQSLLINAVALLAVAFVAGAAIRSGLREDALGAAVTGVPLLLVVGLIRLYYPRHYEVWPDHLAVVFLIGRWRISYETIDIAYETLPAEHALATSLHGAMPWQLLSPRYGWFGARTITVLRRSPRFLARPSAIIYPEDRREFLEHLQTAMSLQKA